MCPNYEPEGQGRGSTFRVCHALKKMAISLHTEALVDSQMATTVLGQKAIENPHFI